jgi:hypothetical protein
MLTQPQSVSANGLELTYNPKAVRLSRLPFVGKQTMLRSATFSLNNGLRKDWHFQPLGIGSVVHVHFAGLLSQ